MINRVEREAHLEGFWPAGPRYPIVFCDIIGEETQEETGTIDGKKVGIESKHNHTEAKKAVSRMLSFFTIIVITHLFFC